MIKFFVVAVLFSTVNADCGNCDGYMVKDPVCATDGHIYVTLANPCIFKVTACEYALKGVALQIANTGVCSSTGAVNVKPVVSSQTGSLTNPCMTCTSSETYLICGTDGNTYQNKCEFVYAQCKYKLNGQTLDVADLGACRKVDTSGLAFETSGTNTLTSATTQCNMRCDTTQKYPICGTDGVTYQNKCFFYQAKCVKEAGRESLDVAAVGECTKASLTSSLLG